MYISCCLLTLKCIALLSFQSHFRCSSKSLPGPFLFKRFSRDGSLDASSTRETWTLLNLLRGLNLDVWDMPEPQLFALTTQCQAPFQKMSTKLHCQIDHWARRKCGVPGSFRCSSGRLVYTWGRNAKSGAYEFTTTLLHPYEQSTVHGPDLLCSVIIARVSNLGYGRDEM